MNELAPLEFPELVIALAGPIGVDMHLVSESVETAFSEMGYQCSQIKLTDEMADFDATGSILNPATTEFDGADTYNTYMRKMSAANALRSHYHDAALLSRVAINAIRRERAELSGDPDKVVSKRCYIIRQMKRPEEIQLLRTVYRRQFILASAYSPEDQRQQSLLKRMSTELSTNLKPVDIKYKVSQLIDRDANEDADLFGQKLRDTFHVADVFIDGLNKLELLAKLRRFVEALFGKNDISPSKDEYGMYTAKSASLRSADLSRQVGAAIFTQNGELITQGCNEVPKAHGGTYWDLELPDNRDVKKGQDPNEVFKKEILRELVERLRQKEWLSSTAIGSSTDAEIVEKLVHKNDDPEASGALVGSRIMDLTEYGRVVHAEMCALCDAARLGRGVKGATLYCTTFPCHSCTKHLLASGITKVVYLEPYPKSKAKDLHPDEVEIEQSSDAKLSFIPFMGISPFRYRDLFEKGRRKGIGGGADDWYHKKEKPMIDVVFASYTENEKWAIADLFGSVKTSQ